MSGRRTVAAGFLAGALGVLASPGGATAQPATPRAHAAKDVDATSSVTLGRLSVKMLGVDRPWDPHICIGCGVNNGLSAGRVSRLRFR